MEEQPTIDEQICYHDSWNTRFRSGRFDEIEPEARARGEDDDGRRYYRHWLAALEGLLAEKGLVPDFELKDRFDAWAEAARTTPHGKPIVLPGR